MTTNWNPKPTSQPPPPPLPPPPPPNCKTDPLGRCLYQEDEVLLAIRLGFAYALEEYGIWKDGERTIGCLNNNIKDVLKNFDDEKLAEKILLRVEAEGS